MKKLVALFLAVLLAGGLLAGCGGEEDAEKAPIRIGALKGPTSMGLLCLINDESVGKSGMEYDFRMATGADELLPLLVRGELDIALVPANVAGILYARTEGKVCVIDINTLGVLYMVSGDGSIQSVADLRGRTIYLTGKGTTPDHVLRFLLEKNGIAEEECALEYKSEATEVAVVLAEHPDAAGLLPQPFVTAACMQNEALGVVLDMNEEWRGTSGFELVTGVTVVRRDFLEENERAVQAFLEDHGASVRAMEEDPETWAVYAVQAGIVAKEAIAREALPACNIRCITGEAMKSAVSCYLEALYGQAPEAVGGALPGEDFYYLP